MRYVESIDNRREAKTALDLEILWEEHYGHCLACQTFVCGWKAEEPALNLCPHSQLLSLGALELLTC